MLSKKQENIKNVINNIFISGQFDIIYLSGLPGGGKSFLVKNYLEDIYNFEDWKAFYIEGKSGDVNSYSTIIHADDVQTPTTEHTGKNFNLGFNIFKVLTIGLTSTSRKKEIFDSKIDFFIKMIRNLPETNIVIVADSFEFWDDSSKSLITAIINHSKITNHKRIRLLIVSNEKDSSKMINVKTNINSVKELELTLPKSEEIQEIVSILGYSLALSKEEIEAIMHLSGANLDYIKLVVEAMSADGFLLGNNTDNEDFKLRNILENRLKMFGNREIEAQQILRASSIINDEFNSEEVQFLCEGEKNVNYILNESCTFLFLKKGNRFTFSNHLIREFFYKKLSGTQAQFHFQYAQYLKLNRPENYLSRAIHLSLADERGENVKEIFGLFALAYSRNIEISADGENQFLIQTLNNYLDQNLQSQFLKKDFNRLCDAYMYYLSGNYDSSYKELSQISMSHSLLFRSEVLRLQLLVSLMLDLNTFRITEDTEALCSLLEEIGQEESEQWAQCNFTLFSTYTNKLGQFDKGKKTVEKLQIFISKQTNRTFFEYLGRLLGRKSFLFKSAEKSVGPMADSVAYFKIINDHLQYYFALCNYAGVLIVLNRLEEATSHLNGCVELIKEIDYIRFPSTEKIYNNLFLADFLAHFRGNKKIEQQTISRSIMNFKSKIHDASAEMNAVMVINLSNIYLINEDYENYNSNILILKNTILVNNVDSFYSYHLTNLELAKSILQRNWNHADYLLSELKKEIPDFHTENKINIQNRFIALELLVQKRLTLNPAELDHWVYTESKPRDESSFFHCRLFLFSDLQFSSL